MGFILGNIYIIFRNVYITYKLLLYIMPKKKYFSKDLITTTMSRKTYFELSRKKKLGEPMYHLLDMIVSRYLNPNNEMQNLQAMLEMAEDGRDRYKAKYEELRKGVGSLQTTLDTQVEVKVND